MPFGRPSVVSYQSLINNAVRFHLTGGITSVAWGEPRMTQDIDLVVDNETLAGRLDSFLASLADPFSCSTRQRFATPCGGAACFSCSTQWRASNWTSARGR
jgi:hypothetical protein